jgi:hypothetical protein
VLKGLRDIQFLVVIGVMAFIGWALEVLRVTSLKGFRDIGFKG